jgi:nucleotide-binding universal stress UspA family protein
MTFKHILVHVEPGAGSEERLKYAMALAASFDAKLTGLTVTVPPSAFATGVAGESDLYNAALEAAEESSAAAKAQFKKQAANWGIESHWRSGYGLPVDVISAEAGCADLIVLGREDRRDLEDSFYTFSPAAVLMACGRPVLVLPDAGPEAFHARRILLGWKNTREATRAAHDALPLCLGVE